MSERFAHLTADRATNDGRRLWWVDLSTVDEGVIDQQQYAEHERDQALAYCAQHVHNGMILEFSDSGELERTIEVVQGRVVSEDG